MRALQQARSWWQRVTGEEETPLDGDTPAWLVSMTIHVAILLGLSLCVVPIERRDTIALAITQPVEIEPDPQHPDFVCLESLTPDPGDDTEDTVPVRFDVPLAPEMPAPAEIADLPSVELLTPDVDDRDFLEPTRILSRLEPSVSDGTVNVSVRDAGDALDYLTGVIRESVIQRPTTVCWVFDQSISLAGQRKKIAARLANVAAELDSALEGVPHHDLDHAVFAYGEKVTPFFSEPSADTRDVANAILAIPVDESGIENTFRAIHEAVLTVAKFSYQGKSRNVPVIVFTDEVGNDEHLADDLATFLCRQRVPVPVYVVGVPAPFGRKKVPIRFVEYDTEQFAGGEQWAEVDQGPETLFPEFLRIRSGGPEDEPMDSGFGPFSLSKLCYRTNGRYLCLHANRSTAGPVDETAPMASRLRFFFDPQAMRPYQPEYAAATRIQKNIEANKAKLALFTVSRALELEPMREQRRVFPKKNDTAFVGLLCEAQHAAAALAPRVDAIYHCLEAGRGDRTKIREKRWQATYDLALGRVLAAKVRVDAYNQILANAKQGPKFRNPKNDTWELVPSNDITNLDSANAKNAKQSRQFLEQVVAEHPGTPWALIAARELETPLGYIWKETFTNVNPPQPPPRLSESAGNAKPADDRARERLAPPKPPRPLKNL